MLSKKACRSTLRTFPQGGLGIGVFYSKGHSAQTFAKGTTHCDDSHDDTYGSSVCLCSATTTTRDDEYSDLVSKHGVGDVGRRLFPGREALPADIIDLIERLMLRIAECTFIRATAVDR